MDERLLGKLRAGTNEARDQRRDEEDAAAILDAIEKRGGTLREFLRTAYPLTRDEIIKNLGADDDEEVTFYTHLGDHREEEATYNVELGFFNGHGAGHLPTDECRRKVKYQKALRDKLADYFSKEGFTVATDDDVNRVEVEARPEDEGYYPSGTRYTIRLSLSWDHLMAPDQEDISR